MEKVLVGKLPPPKNKITEFLLNSSKTRSCFVVNPQSGLPQSRLEQIKAADFIENVFIVEKDDRRKIIIKDDLVIIHGQDENEATCQFPELKLDNNLIQQMKLLQSHNAMSKEASQLLVTGYAALGSNENSAKLTIREDAKKRAKATVNTWAFDELPKWGQFCAEFKIAEIKFPVNMLNYHLKRYFLDSKNIIIASVIEGHETTPVIWYDKTTNTIYSPTNPYNIRHQENGFLNKEFGAINGCLLTNLFINHFQY